MMRWFSTEFWCLVDSRRLDHQNGVTVIITGVIIVVAVMDMQYEHFLKRKINDWVETLLVLWIVDCWLLKECIEVVKSVKNIFVEGLFVFILVNGWLLSFVDGPLKWMVVATLSFSY